MACDSRFRVDAQPQAMEQQTKGDYEQDLAPPLCLQIRRISTNTAPSPKNSAAMDVDLRLRLKQPTDIKEKQWQSFYIELPAGWRRMVRGVTLTRAIGRSLCWNASGASELWRTSIPARWRGGEDLVKPQTES
ncbi:hypothetical protein NM208_g731 [Fusarium decemcellulare]|uniref:Uncharacterized protein n=1 Tax=Fusarium decemcellulare TaxID=57161 RepID=A0ACC1SYA6_9HYPO|nr:hypothetical protein NM208_g731 [Fusarium decemcellulare]